MSQEEVNQIVLEVQEIALQDESPKGEVVDEIALEGREATQWFVKQIAVIIAENFLCYTYNLKQSKRKGRATRVSTQIRFVGHEHDVHVAKQVFALMKDFICHMYWHFYRRSGIMETNDWTSQHVFQVNAMFTENVEGKKLNTEISRGVKHHIDKKVIGNPRSPVNVTRRRRKLNTAKN